MAISLRNSRRFIQGLRPGLVTSALSLLVLTGVAALGQDLSWLSRPSTETDVSAEFSLSSSNADIAPDMRWLSPTVAPNDISHEFSLGGQPEWTAGADPVEAELGLYRQVAEQVMRQAAHESEVSYPGNQRRDKLAASDRTSTPQRRNQRALECTGCSVRNPTRCQYCSKCANCCQGECRSASEPIEARPWNFSVLTGFEYDSNVAARPEIIGLGIVASKDDVRWNVASFGDYRIVQEPERVLGLLMSTFSSTQFDQSEFNLSDFMGGAYLNQAFGRSFAGIRYEFHKTMIDGEELSAEHRFVPSFTLRQDGHGHLTTFYEYDSLNSRAPALIPEQEQSGGIHALGATKAYYTSGGDGRFYVGYRYENANTEGADFERHSNMVTSRVECPTKWQWIADAEIRYFWDNYTFPNSLDFFDRPRADERFEFRAGLQRLLAKNMTLRLDYTLVSTNSNVENLFGVRFYEYDRQAFSTQLIYDF